MSKIRAFFLSSFQNEKIHVLRLFFSFIFLNFHGRIRRGYCILYDDEDEDEDDDGDDNVNSTDNVYKY